MHVACAREPLLIIRAGGQLIKQYTPSDLRQNPAREDVHIEDAIYRKPKHFAGIPLLALLNQTYSDTSSINQWSSITFVAEDGYEAVASMEALLEGGAFLVDTDLHPNGWEVIERKGVIPGPFYLVWTRPEQLPKNGYPWPWQIKSINLLDFEETYPATVPGGAANDGVNRGFQLFRSRCFSCHSMNQQGGKIGPDLNAPRSITEYRSVEFLKEFISNAGSFRYSKMPLFTDLSEHDLEGLIQYFQFMSGGHNE